MDAGLYVGIAEQIGGDGQIVVVNVDPADQPPTPTADLSSEAENPRFWHRVLGSYKTVHAPMQIVPTAFPDKLAVTCAYRPHRFYALKVVDDRPNPQHFSVQLRDVMTNLYFPDIHVGRNSYNIDDAWSVAVMPDLSYAFVSDLNWSVLAHGRVNPGANVGVVRDPFGMGPGPLLMATTTPIEGGEANALALSPDGSRLFVSYSGIGEVLVMDTAEMIRAVESLPSSSFIFTPLDQQPNYDIHITPITVGGWAGGFSFQQPNEPPQARIEGRDALFVMDYDRELPNETNLLTIHVANDASVETSPAPMLVQVDIDGPGSEFLLDENDWSARSHYEFFLPAGEAEDVEFRAKEFLTRWLTCTFRILKQTDFMVLRSTLQHGMRGHRFAWIH
jgi:hypothetical protein